MDKLELSGLRPEISFMIRIEYRIRWINDASSVRTSYDLYEQTESDKIYCIYMKE